MLIIIQNYHLAESEKKMKSQPSVKTRWKRENLFKKIQHEIEGETESVGEKTGVSPWIILGTKSVEYFFENSQICILSSL